MTNRPFSVTIAGLTGRRSMRASTSSGSGSGRVGIVKVMVFSQAEEK
ncbi:MAG: hypothetical protein SGJ24_14765 [Chloroflexota bacterium]|nr:hypothetical protein [Chloroflexota bacterium]